MSINIEGIDKILLLKELWSNQKVASFFTSNMVRSPTFDLKLAEKAIQSNIDYFQGRAIKANLNQKEVDFSLYDRDAKIPAKEIIERLKKDQTIIEKEEDDEVRPPQGALCFYCNVASATQYCHYRYACSSCNFLFKNDEAAKDVFGEMGKKLYEKTASD